MFICTDLCRHAKFHLEQYFGCILIREKEGKLFYTISLAHTCLVFFAPPSQACKKARRATGNLNRLLCYNPKFLYDEVVKK